MDKSTKVSYSAEMAPLLLTAEQARRNLELFQHESGKSKGNDVVAVETSIGEAISQASALNLPEKTSPPPSSVETFSNPKLHVDVISTFLASSMVNINYIPNSSPMDPVQEQKAFVDLYADLLRFGSYMPLVESRRTEFSYEKEDCKALLEQIESIVGESGMEPTIVMRQLIIQAASLTSREETKTMFVVYHFQGAESNPALYMFYGVANVLRSKVGKSTATANQSIQVYSYKFEIDSKLVSSMADALAITIVPAETLTKIINARFLLPTD